MGACRGHVQELRGPVAHCLPGRRRPRARSRRRSLLVRNDTRRDVFYSPDKCAVRTAPKWGPRRAGRGNVIRGPVLRMNPTPGAAFVTAKLSWLVVDNALARKKK